MAEAKISQVGEKSILKATAALNIDGYIAAETYTEKIQSVNLTKKMDPCK